MLFNSFHFFVFFLAITAAYFLLPHRYRWFLLLASSCYFYMVFIPFYILILGFTIVIDYCAGILLENNTGRNRKLFLVGSLIANIGVLFIFKYFNFINDNLSVLLSLFHIKNQIQFLSIALPIGLSFHTFQAMSYTIEVYRGKQKAERNFGIYALYVMFYPQLVAGPIERPQNLLHQFFEEHHFDYAQVTSGLRLIAWGLFKKVVIADRLATVVDNVYDNSYNHQGLSMVIATVFFSFQIFCDFSGYSDIAIGAARVMGFKLMKNFDRPYHSKTISEFWKRWHISLSTWFGEYVFLPITYALTRRLTKSQYGFVRTDYSIFIAAIGITFLLSGLWHGANWTFVIWGALHGFYVIFGLLTKKWRNRVGKAAGLYRFPVVKNGTKIMTTFVLTTFAWIFFRARSVPEAFYIIKNSVTGLYKNCLSLLHHTPLNLNLGIDRSQLAIGVSAIILMECIHAVQNKHSIGGWLQVQPRYLRWLIYYLVFFAILFLGVYEKRQFIYFQF